MNSTVEGTFSLRCCWACYLAFLSSWTIMIFLSIPKGYRPNPPPDKINNKFLKCNNIIYQILDMFISTFKTTITNYFYYLEVMMGAFGSFPYFYLLVYSKVQLRQRKGRMKKAIKSINMILSIQLKFFLSCYTFLFSKSVM